MTDYTRERIEFEKRVREALGLGDLNIRSVGLYLGPHEPPSVTVKVYLRPEEFAAITQVESPAYAASVAESIAPPPPPPPPASHDPAGVAS